MIPIDYEYYDTENLLDRKIIRYAKKYGEIFNKYESVNIVYNNDVLVYIYVCDNKPESTQVNITKEDAVKILEENNIEYDELALQFDGENLYGYDEFHEENEIYIVNDNLNMINKDMRLVWKISKLKKIVCEIDAQNGELIKEYTLDAEKKE